MPGQTISGFTMRDTVVHDILRFLVLSCLTGCAVAFNVDTKNAIVFKGPSNTYFGYSVAILENSQGTWLLVGAPRAGNTSKPGVVQPGAVFQCHWKYRSSCQPVFIDNIGNERQVFQKWKKNITVEHIKDNQWMGASVNVNVHGSSQVMVCAPRWIDNRFEVQGLRLMNGLCYESNRDLHFSNSSAWPALEEYKKQIHPEGYFSYGMGSLGTSAVYSKNGKFSVLGAPGLNDWSGGFVYIEGNTSRPRIMELSADMESNSYFGISVTTAKLTAEGVSIVIGGPRSGGHGKVLGYNINFELILVKEGSQIGSSFGAAVCAVDLNGDTLDDLVVGAPLFSESGDEGRAYVYINKEFFNLELMGPLLKGSNAPGARFGSAIANIGDLDMDDYEDIAIGAPYEADAGVVYIYNGAKSGLRSEPSQRIVGKNIAKDLKAFGWSFSQPWDVDGNHYVDFAVGSFESDRVVLLKTRPVFNLYASLEISPAVIDMNSAPNCVYYGQPWHCLEVSICLRYKGQDLPPSAELNITLRLDTLERHRDERVRLFMQGEGQTEVESTNVLVVVRLDQVLCSTKYRVYIRKSRDVITPLKLELEYDIASSSLGFADLGTTEPIRNKYNPRAIHMLARFALDCGDDHVCIPDLNIMAAPLFNNGDDHFLIDDTPSFDLEILVSNNGETSFLTVVTIDYPPSIYFSAITVTNDTMIINCAPAPDRPNVTIGSLTCDFMRPLISEEKVVLAAKFYAYGMPYDVHEFEVKARVKSEGQGVKESSREKEVVLTIPVHMRSEMTLFGASIPGQLALPRELFTSDEEVGWSYLSHLYILRNLGPSPMPHGQLTLSVPTTDWLRLTNVEVETKSTRDALSYVPVECSMPSERNGTETNQGDQTGVKTKQQNDNMIHFINCDSLSCSNVTCYIGLMHKSEVVYINISLEVKKHVLQLLKIDNQLAVMSSGLLRKPDYVSYNTLTTGSSILTTTYIMYKTVPRQGVTWWVLVISISSGLLLLYILAVLLWKCGFFRRKQREELQELIRSLDAEQEVLHSDSLSAGSGDIMVFPSGHTPRNANHTRHNSGLFFYPHLEPDHRTSDQNLIGQSFFQNHSLNRRDISHGSHQMSNFHTLPCNNNNHRSINYRDNSYRNGHSHTGFNPQSESLIENPQRSIWMAPPAAPVPPPSFNNDMYLEPLESRA